ncbi:MAG: hypothetical protein CR997_12950 [Acidobacteria bacterium]|nr:MAG: hypothetical protein CR997_12950 [Acidobacteriota bacterium]
MKKGKLIKMKIKCMTSRQFIPGHKENLVEKHQTSHRYFKKIDILSDIDNKWTKRPASRITLTTLSYKNRIITRLSYRQ